MKRQILQYCLLTIMAMISIQVSKAQSVPFNCDYSAYLFQTNDVYALDLASGNSFLVAADVTPGNINGAGYNPADGYIWGYLSSPASSIVRIGQNFNTTTYTIPNLPSGNKYVGDIDSNGIYHCKAGGTTYYKIDLNPNSSTYLDYLGSFTLSASLSIADWAFNAVDGQLYTAEKGTNNLYRINPANGQVSNLGTIPAMQGLNYTYGAVYFDSSGRFYISANQTGTVYVVQSVQNLTGSNAITSNLFCFGPSSSSNDGARCPTAPVPQENCTNGIDDDNDGLTDCDDPACSGIAACPTIAAPVAGGNQGGLESNRRLSQQINKRNYLRRKNNFQFNAFTAPNFQPALAKTSGDELNLSQLIPQTALAQTIVKESSALDLLDITNAKELLSVDYLRDNKTIAVILATKTEQGIYEHTKYICDRLLGSELINVSTITINEKEFIRSIIKNNDGSMEFVLTFSAYVNENDKTMIESHWNIDQYPADKDYYNFQIWTNQIDDLVQLTTKTLELFDTQKPIEAYTLSSPPPVFVKKGKYVNGALALEIVNSNQSNRLNINAGLKTTETSDVEFISKSFDITENYLNKVNINTGKLFDIGFRISNETNTTPDDLFLSDGPWGLDYDNAHNNIIEYEVTESETSKENGFSVERNVSLEMETNTYFSLYRAFTPRFKSVNLSAFNTLAFEAKGNGNLEITIIKEGIDSWEKQFKTNIALKSENNAYYIPLVHFTSSTGNKLKLDDAISIVFTMNTEDGKKTSKFLTIGELNFSHQEQMIPNGLLANQKIIVSPNPMQNSGAVHFSLEKADECQLRIFNLTGHQVMTKKINGLEGLNTTDIQTGHLQKGVYLLQIKGSTSVFNTQKIIIE